jgi:hypothetical protein
MKRKHLYYTSSYLVVVSATKRKLLSLESRVELVVGKHVEDLLPLVSDLAS